MREGSPSRSSFLLRYEMYSSTTLVDTSPGTPHTVSSSTEREKTRPGLCIRAARSANSLAVRSMRSPPRRTTWRTGSSATSPALISFASSPVSRGLLVSALTVACGLGDVPLVAQDAGEHPGHLHLVLDYQDACHHPNASSNTAGSVSARSPLGRDPWGPQAFYLALFPELRPNGVLRIGHQAQSCSGTPDAQSKPLLGRTNNTLGPLRRGNVLV